MRYTLIVVAALALAAPATASVERTRWWPDCSARLIRSANHHRAIVIKLHGRRAPGRDIVRWGRIGPNQRPHKVKDCARIRRYRDQLVQLHTPAPYPSLVRTAVDPARPPAGAQTPSVTAGPLLQRIRACESGGNYATNTGNGFYGAYQFDLQTWQSVGGSGLPSDASPAEQDMRAAMLLAQRGTQPWPVCGS